MVLVVSVYRRKQDGRWCAAVSVRGRRRVFYGRSASEAKRKATEFLRVLGPRPLPQPGSRTLADLLRAYLDTSDLRARTRETYEGLARRYLQDLLDRKLANIEAQDLQVLYVQLQDRPRAAAQVHRLLHRLFEVAVRWSWLVDNPAKRVNPPRYRPPERRTWTAEELGRFLSATEGRWRVLFTLLAATGLRVSEALALRWQDVDLDQGLVHVRRVVHPAPGGGFVFEPPKTQAGLRTVALPEEVMRLLLDYRQASGGSEEALMFTRADGKPLHRNDVARAMRRVSRRAGLSSPGPHALRHLHGSHLLACGVPLADVSRRLGHSKPTVTLAIYAHSLGEDRRVAEVAGDLVGSAAPRRHLGGGPEFPERYADFVRVRPWPSGGWPVSNFDAFNQAGADARRPAGERHTQLESTPPGRGSAGGETL